MRSRSRVLSPTASNRVYLDVTVGGSDSSDGPYVTSFDNESMVDIVTPGFSKAMKSGAIIENPCTYQKSSLETQGSGQAQYTLKNGSGQVVYNVVATGPTTAKLLYIYGYEPPLRYNSLGSSMSIEELIAESRTKALANIDPSALSTGEDLLEFRETLRFLRSPLRGIFNALSQKGIRSLADLTTDVWLSLRFGVTPLVISIDQLLREASSPTPKPPELLTARGFASRDRTSGGNIAFGPTGDRSNLEWAASSAVVAKSTIHYRLNKPLYDWRWRYGLRNKDVLPSLWAVMPLSFMVDRIFDVTSMIQAAQNLADPSVQILGATTVVRENCTNSCYVSSYSTTNVNATYSGHGETRIRKFFEYSRTPYTPSLSDVIPNVNDMGLTKDLTSIADLLALINARLR
jgi:hypothetical protein